MKKTIGSTIRDLRKENRVTQPELAAAIGVANSVISNWENGTNIPRSDYVVLLAKFFNVSADFILGLEDEWGNKLYDINIIPEGDNSEIIQIPVAARSKDNKARNVQITLTKEQLEELLKQVEK